MGQHQLGNFLVLRVGNSVFIFITWFQFFWKKKKRKKKGGGGVGRFWYFIVFDRMLVCYHQSYHGLGHEQQLCVSIVIT